MKLATILNKHSECTPGYSLPDCLGDGFLIQHNKIYSKIRQYAHIQGFSYTKQIWPEYLAFPMGQLETILQKKQIPYVNNVEPLKTLNEKAKGRLDWDHVTDNLKPNYVFHESCHAIAHPLAPDLRLPNQKSERILALIIEESFANTCEFFAIADANDQIHRFFLEKNSYFTIFEDRTHLKTILEKFDPKMIFKFMLLCYIHSNFLNERLDDKDFKKILHLLAEPGTLPETKILKSLAANTLTLNPRFRYTTTEMYLRLIGIEEKLESALNFDFLSLLKTNSLMDTFISKLSDIYVSSFSKHK